MRFLRVLTVLAIALPLAFPARAFVPSSDVYVPPDISSAPSDSAKSPSNSTESDYDSTSGSTASKSTKIKPLSLLSLPNPTDSTHSKSLHIKLGNNLSWGKFDGNMTAKGLGMDFNDVPNQCIYTFDGKLETGDKLFPFEISPASPSPVVGYDGVVKQIHVTVWASCATAPSPTSKLVRQVGKSYWLPISQFACTTETSAVKAVTISYGGHGKQDCLFE